MNTSPPSQKAIDAHVEAVIVPVLQDHGAVIVARNYDDFYNVLTIEFRGERITVVASVVGRADPKGLRFFLRHFDEVREIVKRLMAITDPFYSDISIAIDTAFDTAFGKQRSVDERLLVFSFICSKLRAAGKHIWTND